MRLYDKFITLLIAVNDETVSREEHERRDLYLSAWIHGAQEARKSAELNEYDFNGDYYYLDLKVDRPMVLGRFLDWNEAT